MSNEAITAPVESTKPKPTGKPLDKKILALGIGLLVVGFVMGQGSGGSLPWAPKKNRPILSAIARLAKLGLWIMVVEPVPEDALANQYTRYDADAINHREGW